MNNFTKEQLQKIINSADTVLTALDGTGEKFSRDDSAKMCEAWDYLNDVAAPPALVKQLAEFALAALTAEQEKPDLVLRPFGEDSQNAFIKCESDHPFAVKLFLRAAPPAPAPFAKLIHFDDGTTDVVRIRYPNQRDFDKNDWKNEPNGLELFTHAAPPAQVTVPDGWETCSPEWIARNGPDSCATSPRIAFGSVGPHYHPHTCAAPPAPVKLPKKIPRPIYDFIYEQCGGFVDCDANAQKIWEAFTKFVKAHGGSVADA